MFLHWFLLLYDAVNWRIYVGISSGSATVLWPSGRTVLFMHFWIRNEHVRYLLHELAPFQGGCISYARPGGTAVIKSAIVNLNKTTRPLRHCIQAQKQRIYFICVSFTTIAIACSTFMWLIAVSDSSLISTINYNTPHCYFHWAYIFPPLLSAHIKYTPPPPLKKFEKIFDQFVMFTEKANTF